MEKNEVYKIMDLKLHVHDKIRLKQWTKCQVKIEAVACLPCFLRITFTPKEDDEAEEEALLPAKSLSVSINLPDVTISLVSSRTREFAYGLFWAQSRRNCFIYFALETENKCKQLMKWMKKSIKNLELYRQIVLEQRRNSRGSENKHKTYLNALGPLPSIPSTINGISSNSSDIYEEILYADITNISRDSVASGIYEEMKPSINFNNKQPLIEIAPPLPPIPPIRKRINTYEADFKSADHMIELPRCNTNPETEAIKKKKYKNMFDNLFGGGRSKRAESVSETQACCIDDIINSEMSKKNDEMVKNSGNMCLRKRKRELIANAPEKRNSFSSPDLSKINLLHFDENDVDIIKNSFSISRDLTLSYHTLNKTKAIHRIKTESIDNLNISAKISNNFNFSACNNSKINLVGAYGATNNVDANKLKIPIEDLTGYCLMAPIPLKSDTNQDDVDNSTKEETHIFLEKDISSSKTEDSAIYVNMNGSANSSTQQKSNKYETCISPSILSGSHLNNHLYENVLTMKAAQELETVSSLVCTSTPTDCKSPNNSSTLQTQQEENFYQTPRKSTISVEDKIASYYPYNNDCFKTRRCSRSPLKERIISSTSNEVFSKSTTKKPDLPTKMRPLGHRSYKQTARIKEIGNDNISKTTTAKALPKNYKTAAQKISENVYAVARKSSTANNNSNLVKKSNKFIDCANSEDSKKKITGDLLQLAEFPKIDFKFDDIKSLVVKDEKAVEDTLLRAPNTTNAITRAARSASTNTNTPTVPPKMNTKESDLSTPPTNTPSTEVEGYAAQLLQLSGMKKFASMPRLKKIDFSPLRMKINNVLQRHQTPPHSVSHEQK